MELAVDGKTAVFVSSHASGPTFIELVFPLDELSLCGGNVSFCGRVPTVFVRNLTLCRIRARPIEGTLFQPTKCDVSLERADGICPGVIYLLHETSSDAFSIGIRVVGGLAAS